MRCAAVALIGLLLATLPARAAQPGERVCLLQMDIEYGACLRAADPVDACSRALREEPADFRSRAALCEAYAQRGEYDRAIETLNAGRRVHSDRYTVGLIERALSNVQEAQSATDSPGADLDTLLSYLTLRCTTLKNLQACEEALRIDPDNVAALTGQGEALSASGDLVGAIQAFRKAMAADGKAGPAEQLAAAEQARRRRVDACLQASRPAAIADCRAVLLPGEDDGYDIQAKIGALELAAGALSRARDAYAAAHRIRPGNATEAMVEGLTRAERCLDDQAVAACSAALQALPDTALVAGLRARLALADCRLLTRSASPGTRAQAESACARARRLDPSSAGQIDTWLAALPAPKPEPPPIEAPVETPAPAPAEPVVDRLAESIDRCVNFSGGSLPAAARACERVLDERPDMAEVAAALSDIRQRLAPYSNDPLLLSQGHEAVSY